MNIESILKKYFKNISSFFVHIQKSYSFAHMSLLLDSADVFTYKGFSFNFVSQLFFRRCSALLARVLSPPDPSFLFQGSPIPSNKVA